MYKRIVVVSVLAVGNLHAMDGRQTLQVVVNTPVARTLRWLSSGTPEANVAAVAVAVCVAKPALEIVTWPVRRWWFGAPKSDVSQQELDVIKQRLCAAETALNPESIQAINLFVTTRQVESSRNTVVNEEFSNVKARCAALEAKAPSAEATSEIASLKQSVRQLTAQVPVSPRDFGALYARVQALENRHSGAIASACPGHGDIEALRQEVSEFKKQNGLDHTNIRADNLSMFTQKLASVETDLATLRSQVKILQNGRTGQAFDQK